MADHLNGDDRMGRCKGHGPGTESNRVLRTALLGTANVILRNFGRRIALPRKWGG